MVMCVLVAVLPRSTSSVDAISKGGNLASLSASDALIWARICSVSIQSRHLYSSVDEIALGKLDFEVANKIRRIYALDLLVSVEIARSRERLYMGGFLWDGGKNQKEIEFDFDSAEELGTNSFWFDCGAGGWVGDQGAVSVRERTLSSLFW
jgi:hypothetical protein